VSGKEKRVDLNTVSGRQRDVSKELVCQHYKPIYRFMVYLAKDSSLAEDLTQEVFLCAWEKLGSYKGGSSVLTWLHKIAYHKFIDSQRRFQCEVAAMSKISNEPCAVPHAVNPLQKLMADDELSRIYKAMQKLDSDEYLIMLLHYIQKLSFGQMAEVLEQSVGTVKWKTNQALKKMRTYLCDEGKYEIPKK
jgi:RNA polymerase sigma-70 factor, ECF subfamily